ncbi:MAG: hypothetical protein KTR33_09605 [Gammaproteobacteria bacterium]|nr:hypothetical protein [Gammaproteobacteria bacterium]
MRQIIKALSQVYLDLNFKTSNGLHVQIAEFPARWMDHSALSALRQDLRTVAATSLSAGDLDYGVFSADSDRLKQTIVTLVKQRDGTPIAFNALAVIETEAHTHRIAKILHLGLVMIDPGQRSRGLSWILYGLTCFLLFLRNGLRPLSVSNVTQVPAVAGLVAETFSNVYPTPASTENADFQKLLLARAIMADHRHVFGVGPEAEFDENSFIITNAYTGGSDHLKKSFEQAAKHRIEHYNSYCEKMLDYERGDDLLQIGQIDLAAASSYISKQVPKGSILNVMALSLLVAMRRVILPVSHWFNSNKDYGNLRALKK